jgi:hypothetical protein
LNRNENRDFALILNHSLCKNEVSDPYADLVPNIDQAKAEDQTPVREGDCVGYCNADSAFDLARRSHKMP